MGITKRLSQILGFKFHKLKENKTFAPPANSIAEPILNEPPNPLDTSNDAFHLLQLPSEIVTYIVSFTNSDHSNLCNLALTCRSLKEPAHRALFAKQSTKLLSFYQRSVIHSIPERFGRFKDFALNGSHLHHFVRLLNINHEIPAPNVQVEAEIRAILVSFIRACPNLSRLELYMHSNSDFIASILEAVHSHPHTRMVLRMPPNAVLSGAPIQTSSIYIISQEPDYTKDEASPTIETIRQAGYLLTRIRDTVTSIALDSGASGYVTAAAKLQFPKLTSFSIYENRGGWPVNATELTQFLRNHSTIKTLSLTSTQDPFISANEDTSGFLPELMSYSGSLDAFLAFGRGREMKYISHSGRRDTISKQELIQLGQTVTLKHLSLSFISYTFLCDVLPSIAREFPSLEYFYSYIQPKDFALVKYPELIPLIAPLLVSKLRSLYLHCTVMLDAGEPYNTSEYCENQLKEMLTAIEHVEASNGFVPTPDKSIYSITIGLRHNFGVKRCWKRLDRVDESTTNDLVPLWDYMPSSSFLD